MSDSNLISVDWGYSGSDPANSHLQQKLVNLLSHAWNCKYVHIGPKSGTS